jgi:hypothetical protein
MQEVRASYRCLFKMWGVRRRSRSHERIAEDIVIDLLQFWRGIRAEWQSGICSICFDRKGSVGETRAQLIYALDFGYLKPETFSDLDQPGKTAAACLGGLNRHLNDSNFRGRKFKQRESPPTNLNHQPPNAERRTPNAERRTPNVERRTLNAER